MQIMEDGKFSRYKNSNLKKKEFQQLIEAIQVLLYDVKIYKNENLSLQELADRLNSNRHKVSQAINMEFNKNFYQLINCCRIEESKRLIENQEKLNIKTIMYEVGFVSKSSFYSAFKKATGKTPLQYRRSTKRKEENYFP